MTICKKKKGEPEWHESSCWIADLYLAIPDHWPLEDAVHAKNGRLRRVDDGRAEHRAEYAAVGDGEGAAIHVLHGQLVLFGFLTQSRDAFLDIGVVHVLHVAQNGNHQTLQKKKQWV